MQDLSVSVCNHNHYPWRNCSVSFSDEQMKVDHAVTGPNGESKTYWSPPGGWLQYSSETPPLICVRKASYVHAGHTVCSDVNFADELSFN